MTFSRISRLTIAAAFALSLTSFAAADVFAAGQLRSDNGGGGGHDISDFRTPEVDNPVVMLIETCSSTSACSTLKDNCKADHGDWEPTSTGPDGTATAGTCTT